MQCNKHKQHRILAHFVDAGSTKTTDTRSLTLGCNAHSGQHLLTSDHQELQDSVKTQTQA